MHFSPDTKSFMWGIQQGTIPTNLLVGGMVRVKEDVEDQLKAVNATIVEKLEMDGEDDLWAIKIPSGDMSRMGEITGISFVEMDVPAVRRRRPKQKMHSATGERLGDQKGGMMILVGGSLLFLVAMFYLTKKEWK